MIKVKSKLIRAYSYDREGQRLYLLFTSGRLYCYNDVTLEDCYNFLDSESKGAHFNLFIRGKKPYKQLTKAA